MQEEKLRAQIIEEKKVTWPSGEEGREKSVKVKRVKVKW